MNQPKPIRYGEAHASCKTNFKMFCSFFSFFLHNLHQSLFLISQFLRPFHPQQWSKTRWNPELGLDESEDETHMTLRVRARNLEVAHCAALWELLYSGAKVMMVRYMSESCWIPLVTIASWLIQLVNSTLQCPLRKNGNQKICLSSHDWTPPYCKTVQFLTFSIFGFEHLSNFSTSEGFFRDYTTWSSRVWRTKG